MSVLVQTGAMLLLVAVAGSLADRFGQSVIPAYLAAGVVLGPYPPTELFGFPTTFTPDEAAVTLFHELGLVLLLFFLGLHVDLADVFADARRVLSAGGIDLVVNGGLGVLLGVAFGYDPVSTLVIAGVVYISSSAIITKSLLDVGWIANPESDPILGTLVVEDLVIAVYLTLLSAVVLGGGTVEGVAVSLAKGFGFLAVVAAVGWYGTDYVERAVTTERDELLLLRVLAVTVLVAGLAVQFDISEAVAAFFVGGALAQTDEKDRIEHIMSPARDLFAALFFVAVGLHADVRAIGDALPLLVAAIVASVAGKLASGYLSGRVYGLTERRSARVGAALVTRGEFSLVLASLAMSADAVANGVAEFAIAYTLVMALLGTTLTRYEGRIAGLVGRHTDATTQSSAAS
ncbi:cation:proton antiporter [Halocalculus aciditolerans]|uniref:Potassium transporter n=1 Tax=Halocalculus aciditolerans TaxID=1383812 RepID=A0A830FCN7_9EURY|nr:cation:proton antiporter [Halocalculus aciditolerans]GGL61768.1 potassium transporter [Halocalculus aciditolerans]